MAQITMNASQQSHVSPRPAPQTARKADRLLQLRVALAVAALGTMALLGIFGRTEPVDGAPHQVRVIELQRLTIQGTPGSTLEPGATRLGAAGPDTPSGQDSPTPAITR
jgi:hypothetical protein